MIVTKRMLGIPHVDIEKIVSMILFSLLSLSFFSSRSFLSFIFRRAITYDLYVSHLIKTISKYKFVLIVLIGGCLIIILLFHC